MFRVCAVLGSRVVKCSLLLILVAVLVVGDVLAASVLHTKGRRVGVKRPTSVLRPELLQPGQCYVATSVPEDADWPVSVAAFICVEAPPEEVWQVVTDYEEHQGTVPFVHYCKVVERNGDELVLDYIMKGRVLLIFPWELKLRLELRETPAREIDFRLVEGSMKRYEGLVTLTPQKGRPNQTLLCYRVNVQPNFFVPRWALKWGLKRDLPKMLRAMRRLVLMRES